MRKIKEILLNAITYLFSGFEVLVLGAILVYIFSNGFSSLSLELLTGNYYEKVETLEYTRQETIKDYLNPGLDDSYFSSKWGISFIDTENKAGENIVMINYVDEYSPLLSMTNSSTKEYASLVEKQVITKVILEDLDGNMYLGFAKNGADSIAEAFDKGDIITNLVVTTSGGGIRGSLLTTLYLILLTLLIALPLGVGAAIYLTQYAPKNKITSIMQSMIDMTSGIPSIIFGLVGAIVFIPFMNNLIGSDGGSIASGALTLAIMLLPIIIRTTEEAINVIPTTYRNASLALGASSTQTTFKVILPNALGGILTSVLLSIGRIIGESAALIYAVGTAIKDTAIINQKSTSLAVHIWSLMSGESPNFELSCAISIVILVIVLVLSIITKLVAKKLNKFEVE